MAILYRIKNYDDFDMIFLNGKINEDAGGPLNDLLEKIGPTCTINLKDINEINSLGVRLWVNFMRKFEQTRTVTLEECTPEFIKQINMIPNFKGKSAIKSLFVRYVCEHCRGKRLYLFKIEENMPKRSEAVHLPSIACPRCDHLMEMEEVEEEYFACITAPS